MTMAEHTPGPWMTINERLRDDCQWRVVDAEENGNADWQICQCFGPDAEANACLIAAVPELLAALERTIKALNHTGHIEIEQQCRAAIAKARGKGSA